MAQKKIKATYTGKTEPKGFKKDQEYTLKVTHVAYADTTEVQTEGDEHSARYETAFSFLEAWTNISNVK